MGKTYGKNRFLFRDKENASYNKDLTSAIVDEFGSEEEFIEMLEKE